VFLSSCVVFPVPAECRQSVQHYCPCLASLHLGVLSFARVCVLVLVYACAHVCLCVCFRVRIHVCARARVGERLSDFVRSIIFGFCCVKL